MRRAALLALSLLLLGVVAIAQTAPLTSSLAGKLPGQYKVGESETYCFLADGTVRHWGTWGERSGTWMVQGPQGVITWTKDEVYKPAKPFRDAFGYYEEQGKAKLKFWSLDMPIPAFFGVKTGAACEQTGGAPATGPGVLSFAGLSWDEWTVRSRVLNQVASDEKKRQESPWALEGAVLGYKGAGIQTYQNDFVASQKSFDLGDVTVTFEATGSFRTEFGFCGPQVVFTDPEQMNSEGPFGPSFGVVAYYSWEPGKNDNGVYLAGGNPPYKEFAAKFADAGDAEFRPYKLQVKGGKVTLTSPAGVYTTDAPTAKAGVKYPLVLALRLYDRGKTYTFKVRNLKVVEGGVVATGATTTPATPPLVPVTGPVFGKPCAPAEEFARTLYRSVLGREAGADELRAATDRLGAGRTREDLAKEFFLSQEYNDRNRSDEEFVRDAYRTYLAREADAAGLAGFLGTLKKARKDFVAILDPAGAQRGARGKVLDTFTESTEYKAIKAGCK